MIRKFLWGVITLFLIITGGCGSTETANVHYYRQLAYNHVSPMFPIRGIYEISKAEAAKVPHYIFKYDQNNKLAEIINNNTESWKRHPLTHLQVYRTVISRTNNQEVRTYFNKENKPASNLRGVYKEIYTYNPEGFLTSLEFYDLNDKPMQSEWGVSKYSWEKGNGMIIERRFNLSGTPVPMSPQFSFGTIGIVTDEKGYAKATYNLNNSLQVVNDPGGIASYQDKYDERGNHLQWAYFDQENKPVKTSGGYALANKFYDAVGNVVKVEYFDPDHKLTSQETFQYNESANPKF